VAAHAQNGAPSPSPAAVAPGLSEDFYSDTCPDVLDIIEQKVGEWIQKDSTLAPSILRLHFHDCAVRVIEHFL
jgi:peroxidase